MIGILNAYHFDPTPGNYQESYSKLMLEFARRCFPTEEIKNFDVALNDWPASTNQCQLWFITGSGKSAYDSDPWILKLQDFVRELYKAQRKIIGICFGHQIVAQALGGLVEKSSRGWGVGVREFEIIQTQEWMNPAVKKLNLLFSHQDQVKVLPPQAKLLAKDDFCPIQMYQIGKEIFCFQGHPEFSVQFAKDRLLSRKALVTEKVFTMAIESFVQKDDRDILVQWVKQFSAV